MALYLAADRPLATAETSRASELFVETLRPSQYPAKKQSTKTVGERTLAGSALLAFLLSTAVPCSAGDDHIGARTFALLCAKNAVPVGVVSPPVVMAFRSPDSADDPRFDHEAPFGVGLPHTLTEFNRRNGFCRAELVGAVVHVRANDVPPAVTTALRTVAAFETDLQGPASSYVAIAGDAIRGGERLGFVGSGPMPPRDSPLQKPVVIPKGSYSAPDVLDEVVRQAPGTVWFISYHSATDGTRLWVGLMDSRGHSVRLSLDE